MLSLPPTVKVFACKTPVDIRKSFDGLCGCVEQLIGADPLSGHLFVFFNKRATMIKILMWDRSGFCIWYKRLEQGRFGMTTIQSDATLIDIPDLLMILEGIDLTGVKRRKRFKLTIQETMLQKKC